MSNSQSYEWMLKLDILKVDERLFSEQLAFMHFALEMPHKVIFNNHSTTARWICR